MTLNSVAQTAFSISLSVLPQMPTVLPCNCPGSLISANNTCDQICNGSFEFLQSPPNGQGEVYKACPWRIPGTTTPDVFSTTATSVVVGVPNNFVGSQMPVTGSAYGGFIPYLHPALGSITLPWYNSDVKEYLTIPLNQPLKPGECYTLQFYLALSDDCKFACGNIGALFTTSQPSQPNSVETINSTPQILFTATQTSTGWLNYSAQYTALGGETWMTIGNFLPTSNTPVTQVGYINFSNIGSYAAYAYYYIDDVSLTPCCNALAVGSFPLNLCPGDPITLAANTPCTPVTYSWQPASQITGSTTSALTSTTATTSQQYWCDVTLLNYGCTLSATTTVNVLPAPLVNAGPDVTICEGQSTTLTGSGQTVFNGWEDPGGTNICAGCSTITVSPTATTSYVYYAYNSHSGCYGRDQVTVTVLPAPQPQIVSPPGAVTCDNALTFTAAGGPFTTYSWTSNANTITPPTNTSTYTADWTNSYTPPDGSVTLTVTNAAGCTTSVTITVPHCCCGAHVEVVNDDIDDILADNPGVLQLVGGNYVMSTTDMCINGIFTVNHNLILHNVKVYMGTNAKIIVAPGVLFRLEGNGPGLGNQTVIQACDRMWDGIYVDGTNSASLLDIRDGTVIEDAHRAIVSSNGGNFQITGGLVQGPIKLNKNDTAIWIKPYAFLHPCSITNTIFSSDAPGQTGGTPTVTSPGNNCIAPVNKRAKAGIVIETATVNIGNPISIVRRNIFERLQFGIVTTSSTVTVKNNRFINIDRLIGVPFSGYAIYATANKTINGLMNVGGSVPLDSNNFTNCNVGISCNNYVSLNCENNGFFNAPNLALVGTYAIGMFTCNSQTCDILNNRMTRWRTGIWLLDNSNLVADIRSNFINVRPGLNVPVPNSNGLYGIRVNNAVQLPMDLLIRQNDITHCRMGIDLINILTATGNVQARIRYNNIGFDFTPVVFNANVCYGIRVVNSSEMHIDIDTICYNYRQYATGPLPTNALATQCRGIHVENSNNVEVTNNYCNRLGAGIWMEALCPASKITCNHLVRNWNGIYLNNALVGDQYSFSPSDNRFALTPPSGAHSVNADIDGLVQNMTNWYYRNGLGNWFIPNNFPPLPFVPVPNNGQTACSAPQPPLPVQRQSDWSKIVGDSVSYFSPSDEYRNYNRQIAYQHFLHHPYLITLNSPDDSLYNSFTTELSNSPTGYFALEIDSLASGNVTVAAQINNGITSTYYPDQIKQQVNNIYINSWAIGDPNFSSQDSSFLLSVAIENPQVLGDAVYSARVMMNYDDEGSALRQSAENEALVDSSQLIAYPVPADNFVNIQYPVSADAKATLAIYNSLGQLVAKQDLVTGVQHTISTGDLVNGVYSILILENEMTSKTCKIVINH